MFVSPFSEKLSSRGRVGVKQVGREAGHGQAFQGAGPCLPASFQLQLPPEAGAPSTQTPPPDCSALQRKRKERGELPRGSRVLSLAEAEQGLGTLVFRACFILLDWAGIPPLARSPSIPQRLAMDRLRAGN